MSGGDRTVVVKMDGAVQKPRRNVGGLWKLEKGK